MNKPFVKIYNSLGVLTNPITKNPVVNNYGNRNKRRFKPSLRPEKQLSSYKKFVLAISKAREDGKLIFSQTKNQWGTNLRVLKS